PPRVDPSHQPYLAQASRTARPASAIEPGTRYVSAPYAEVSRTITAGVASGITTTTRSPARAPYAAHAAPALPAVGRARTLMPRSAARVTPIAAPRALNVPVGSRPSSLIAKPRMPSFRPSRGAAASGVIGSPSVTVRAGSS